ncbi:MAG: hypothetical protein V2I36_19320, partial [Desulfopila sp.]|nr:hypothetical protein [Desulfopila sp.]
ERAGVQTSGKLSFSPNFSPAEVAVDARREAMSYSCLCTLLQQRCRHGKIGWPLVNIVYGFLMKEKRLNTLECNPV